MKIFTFIIVLFLLVSCKKGDLKAPLTKPCADTTQHNIVSVNGPTSTIVNQEVTFNVSWTALNGCDSFVGFTQDTLMNTITIKAFVKHDSCTVCEMPNPENKSASFKFKPNSKGIYLLKFIRSSGNNITDTLSVN